VWSAVSSSLLSSRPSGNRSPKWAGPRSSYSSGCSSAKSIEALRVELATRIIERESTGPVRAA
jgi:hypothetical protein